MDDFVRTFEDNGGVHINSGIPNQAFSGSQRSSGVTRGKRPAHIWYDALLDPCLKPNSRFRTFARITYDVAGRRFGSASAERQAVRDGWAAVGISV